MRTIESILTMEINQLKKIVKKAKKELETAPKGYLRIRQRKGVVEYYYRDADNFNNNQTNGRYLKKKEAGLAKRIAQRDYNACVIKKAEERIKAIERFLQIYQKTSLKQLYQDMNPFRRELISAVVISDEEYIQQ